MTSIQGTTDQIFSFPGRTLKDSSLVRVLGLLAVLALSVAILHGWDEIKQLGAYGYPAVFLVSLIANAAFLLPAPGVALVFAAGGVLDPVAVGLIAGLGAAIGELTGYAVGMSGQTVFDNQPFYRPIEEWMRKSGTLAIFVLAAVPNPLFDVGGLVAGVMRMPAWRFILSAWFGKSLRFITLAYVGALVAQ